MSCPSPHLRSIRLLTDYLYLIGFGFVVVAIGSGVRWFFAPPETSLVAIAGRAVLAALLFPLLLFLWVALAGVAGAESFTEGVLRGGGEATAVIAGIGILIAALRWGARVRTLSPDEIRRRLIAGGLITGAVLGLVGAGAVALLAVIPHSPVNLSPPTIVGAPRVGGMLTASPGRWNPRTDAKLDFDYFWYRCRGEDCIELDANRKQHYFLVRKDIGARISVSVLAHGDLNNCCVESQDTPAIRPSASPGPRAPAKPQIARLDWKERLGAKGERLEFTVRRFQVLGKRWRASLSMRNDSTSRSTSTSHDARSD
jgi:hypothetical protein